MMLSDICVHFEMSYFVLDNPAGRRKDLRFLNSKASSSVALVKFSIFSSKKEN